MNVNEDHDIPLFVRILGLHFDPQLRWNEQVKILIKRCKKKIFQLGRIAHCADYNLNRRDIWKLLRPSEAKSFSFCPLPQEADWHCRKAVLPTRIVHMSSQSEGLKCSETPKKHGILPLKLPNLVLKLIYLHIRK